MMNQDWLNETISEIKGSNRLYKFLCFCLGKRKSKLTYQEYFLFLYGLNKKNLSEDEAKKKALNRILEIYKELHIDVLPRMNSWDS